MSHPDDVLPGVAGVAVVLVVQHPGVDNIGEEIKTEDNLVDNIPNLVLTTCREVSAVVKEEITVY